MTNKKFEVAHARYLEPPEDNRVVAAYDWKGEPLFIGDEVYLTPEGEYVREDTQEILDWFDKNMEYRELTEVEED